VLFAKSLELPSAFGTLRETSGSPHQAWGWAHLCMSRKP
jgi:hypothetical protein